MTTSEGNSHQRHRPWWRPGFWVIVGGPISVAVGLLFATIAFFVIGTLAGTRDGGYCSRFGKIGHYEPLDPDKVVGYLDEGLSGFPPRDSCSVYLLDATGANPPLSVEEALRREPPPHHLLAHGSYPGSGARLLILGFLIVPPAIWLLLVVATGVRKYRIARDMRKWEALE